MKNLCSLKEKSHRLERWLTDSTGLKSSASIIGIHSIGRLTGRRRIRHLGLCRPCTLLGAQERLIILGSDVIYHCGTNFCFYKPYRRACTRQRRVFDIKVMLDPRFIVMTFYPKCTVMFCVPSQPPVA